MVSCSNCGTSSEGAKFCPECGSPLAEVAASERRERRIVTIVFADLAGFTSRSEALDVEDVDAFLEPYLAQLRHHVARTGGVVSTVAGDGMMAVFGAPVAHEDDPERGVRAALGIRDAFAPGSSAGDAGLHVRVGVTTGEVLVTLMGDGGVRATGDVVNTAARLQTAAPTDGVLVDEVTCRATTRAIVLEPVDAVAAKGKSQPVAAWLAVEPRSVVPEQGRLDGLELVGRDDEAEMLRGALDRSRRESFTQLVSVIGEPGIGKSRLVEELGAYVVDIPDLITWRVGRSLSYGEGVTFWALGEMVKSQAGILESDDVHEAERKLDEAVQLTILDESDRDWVAVHLRPLVGLGIETLGAERVRGEAFAAWRRFFEAIAEEGPTVLVFEDVHWADDALLDFIDLLADRAGAIPLLIVCTARPELFERREHWGGGKTNSTTVSLAPLTSEDTGRLVGALLDQALLPAAMQQLFLERAGGNPLYAQEYVRMLQDRELLTHGEGGWELTGEAADLPESIQGIIAARLDTLSPEEKALIQDAAVIGPTAWSGAVSEVGGQPAKEIDELLHSLERKQLIRRARRSSIRGETEFSFRHALTRDVAYSQIRRADRANKHEVAAAWIERLAGERDDKAELLAGHYQEALALRRQLGEDTTQLAPRASAAFAEAGHQAAANYAHAAALRFFRAALELASVGDLQLRAQLLLGEARALQTLGEVDEPTLIRTVEAQVAAEAWEQAAMAERLLGAWLEDAEHRGDGADVHFALAAEYVSRIPPCDTMFYIAATQAYRLGITGHYSEVLALTNRMIPIAEAAGLDIGRALLLGWQGDARAALGDLGGVTDARQAAATLAEHVYPTTPIAYSNLADVLRGLGDMPGANEAYATALGFAVRFASSFYENFILLEQAQQAYHAGDWDTSDRLVAESMVDQHPADEIQRHISSVRMKLWRGDVEGAAASAEFLIASGTAIMSDENLYHGLASLARARAVAGRRPEALAACDRFLAHWHETGGLYGRGMEVCELAPVLAESGRHEDVRQAAMVLPEIVLWREGLLLIADGSYADAAERYTELGSLPFAADAHLLAANQAIAAGDLAGARRHADAVLEFADMTGAVLYRRQAELALEASA